MDATVLDEASIGKADVVIADLPCSGLGVMRRKTQIILRRLWVRSGQTKK
jgi:16S rRNA (cytosine967-C5)-methyltransferase